tara:strand:+ start:1058 stop:1603 length:546 start_codon:yes stop_codon:yes gene_type:complete
MINKLKNPLTEDYKELKKIVLSNEISWHYSPTTTINLDSKSKDMEFFSHILLNRPDPTDNGIKVPLVTSPYFEKCYLILEHILDFNNIHFDVLYRMNLNLTLHSSVKESTPHIDLPLKHKVIIIYLSSFEEGKTIVLDKNNKKIYSEAKEDNIIMFDGELAHYQQSPTIDDKRVVMVANFL